ncbi:Uma2 family endonuclease [Nocardiopsis gilva YIM 90087]|uniref:Uma2 family endonuclease n=1 Tax=Nocardiopsis gilva YIM 90087 TaxID=1235441 RepID=A0A223S7K3_9ACTN|nr:Uma2 family endonuclease [Nocardiopsis gilva]ASU84117.1 Uma2 family endonuclease [Nocardiopsis gilva YIM 90087]
MAAGPLPEPTERVPDWLVRGFTADEFLQMRGLPPHTELIDGSLVFASPRMQWHSWVVELFSKELDRQAPEHLRATREMSVRIGERQMPEPDVIVIAAEAVDPQATHYLASDVLLAVEAVSPEFRERDRETKPQKYARAGIQHYWRIEQEGSRVVAYLYELDTVTACYAVWGIHHDRLKTSAPYPIDIDLTAVGRRGG